MNKFKPFLIKTEEKGSDVNLSVHLLNDAWLDRYDCAIVVTNYSDMTEALKLVKQEFPQKSIGLISPFKTHTSGLKRYTKSCEIISEQALDKSQFPSPVHSPSGKRYYKPEGW
ncbi:MAG: NYN domain-containing protein [Candidatus Puniceispirillaceae bacterium]